MQTPQADTPWADTPLPSACWDTHTPAQCLLGYTPPCPMDTGIHTYPCPVHAVIHTPLPSACWDTPPLPNGYWDTHIPLPSACWDTPPTSGHCSGTVVILLECWNAFLFWGGEKITLVEVRLNHQSDSSFLNFSSFVLLPGFWAYSLLHAFPDHE